MGKQTTLCYIEKEDCYLMMHRIKKKNDENAGKWIAVGGKFEFGESPVDCALREVKEETGLILDKYRYRGVVTFVSIEENSWCEYMHLFTSDKFHGKLTSCDEGVLRWLPKQEVYNLPMWAGDRIFMQLLEEDIPFFSLKLVYHGEILTEAVLNGQKLPQSVLDGVPVSDFLQEML